MLRITRLADYAVLITCAFEGMENKVVSAPDIIKKTRLQKATVNKVLATLVKKKILIASRGVKGGYKTVKKLEEISVRELIEAMEGPVSLTSCIDKNAKDCNLFNVCITKNTWSLVNNAIKDALENIKIPDMKNKTKTVTFINK